jgi:hypothetical protein
MGAEREINITEFSDDYYTEPKKKKPNVEIAVIFHEETHDGKKVKVSFLNGLLRVEIPLREDITTDVEIQ